MFETRAGTGPGWLPDITSVLAAGHHFGAGSSQVEASSSDRSGLVSTLPMPWARRSLLLVPPDRVGRCEHPGRGEVQHPAGSDFGSAAGVAEQVGPVRHGVQPTQTGVVTPHVRFRGVPALERVDPPRLAHAS